MSYQQMGYNPYSQQQPLINSMGYGLPSSGSSGGKVVVLIVLILIILTIIGLGIAGLIYWLKNRTQPSPSPSS